MRRPTPEQTRELLAGLAGKPGVVMTIPALVRAIQAETGCSRATAYRAVGDALAAGVIKRTPFRKAEAPNGAPKG